MAADEWTRLVQQVDRLITELRAARQEAKQWRTRAIELERLKVKDERADSLHSQSQERELERLRRERKKTVASITRMVAELEEAQKQVLEGGKP